MKVFSYRHGRVGEIKHTILLLQTPYTCLGVEVWGWVGRLFSEQSIWSNTQFSSFVDTSTTIPIGRHSSCLYAENSYQPSYCSWTNLLKMIGGVAGMFSATFFRRVRFLLTGGESWFCRKDWNKEPHDFKCSSNCHDVVMYITMNWWLSCFPTNYTEVWLIPCGALALGTSPGCRKSKEVRKYHPRYLHHSWIFWAIIYAYICRKIT